MVSLLRAELHDMFQKLKNFYRSNLTKMLLSRLNILCKCFRCILGTIFFFKFKSACSCSKLKMAIVIHDFYLNQLQRWYDQLCRQRWDQILEYNDSARKVITHPCKLRVMRRDEMREKRLRKWVWELMTIWNRWYL